jgi:plasmid maintenance system antidote protein VapI
MTENTATTAPATKKATPAKAKAPAKKSTPAKGKATPAKKATAKKDQPVLATKSGVSHPGPLWLEAMGKVGLSQTAAATEMGVAPMTLNRLINGHGIPTAKVTVAFARVTKQQPKKVWAQVCDFELALALEAAEAEAPKA